jgi:PDZ domain-containing protein
MSSPVDAPRGETSSRFSVRSVALAVLLTVLAVLLILELIPSNYYLLMPGEARSVAPLIAVKGHPRSAERGDLLMTDVTFYKVNHKLEELYGRFSRNSELVATQEFSGGLSQSQYIKLNQTLMDNSIEDAEAAALREIPGYHPRYARKSPLVAYLLPKSPAARALKLGDAIKEINGTPVRRSDQVRTLIRRVHPRDVIHLRVLRKNKFLSIAIKTIPSTNGQPSKNGKTALIGVQVRDKLILPVKITIKPGNVVGPSAGMMFALGIIQRLEKGNLTKGCKIAGTGTIDAEGTVGPIGGAKQKVVAASQSGARYFLVPNVKDNVQPARANRGDVTVVPVRTLSEAVRFLRGIKPCR